METNKALTKDEDGEDVDVHLYSSTKSFPLECSKKDLQIPKRCQFRQEINNRRLSISWFKTKIHIDNESAICVVKNPVYHSKTKHIEIRHHFIRDSYEKRLIEMVKIHTDNNVADLLTKAFDFLTFIHGRCIDMDPHEFSHVYLVLSSMLVMNRVLLVTVNNVGAPEGEDEVVHKEGGDSVERAITTAASLDAPQDSDNIIRTQTMAMPNVDIPQGMDTGGSPRRQDTMGVLLLRLGLRECLKSPMNHLSQKVLDLEKEKDAQVVEILRLNKRVKRLEIQRKSSTSQPKRRKYRHVGFSDDELNEEDASKTGEEH
ncbi:hypothetical protein Tco_0897722 [Tanacetum coccineum]